MSRLLDQIVDIDPRLAELLREAAREAHGCSTEEDVLRRLAMLVSDVLSHMADVRAIQQARASTGHPRVRH